MNPADGHLVTPTRSRKRSLGASGAGRATRRTAPQEHCRGQAPPRPPPPSLPAHRTRSPASLLLGAGTAGHHSYPPSQPLPVAGTDWFARRNPFPPPWLGQTPARWGPRGYLHGDGSHAALGLRRSRSLRAATRRPLRMPAPSRDLSPGAELGGLRAGRRVGRAPAFKEERLTRARASPTAALYRSVDAESAGQPRGAPPPSPGGGRIGGGGLMVERLGWGRGRCQDSALRGRAPHPRPAPPGYEGRGLAAGGGLTLQTSGRESLCCF